MHKNAWMPFLLLLSGMLLSGCARGDSSRVVAPTLLDYSAEVQNHAADELGTLGPPCARDAVFGGCSAIKRFVLDYAWVRDIIREGQK